MSGDNLDLLCLGMGYTARRLSAALHGRDWRIGGTERGRQPDSAHLPADIEMFSFEGLAASKQVETALTRSRRVLISIPPGDSGDPTLNWFEPAIRAHPHLRWIGYLSTTGVYGDTGGQLVDEDAPLKPTSARSCQRQAAEAAWLALGHATGLPVHVFRLAGIYGPGRSSLDQVRTARVRRVDFPERKFSRIHVDDVVRVLMASMDNPDAGAIYNVADDKPAAQADVVTVACQLLGETPPPLVPFEADYAEMSEMAKSFWNDNRRIDNRRIKERLGVELNYPNYRAGLEAVLAEETEGT